MKHCILSAALLISFNVQSAETPSKYTATRKTPSPSQHNSNLHCPLISLTSELFAVGSNNQLVVKSYKTQKAAKTARGLHILAEHPDYLTNSCTHDAKSIPLVGQPEHPYHVCCLKDPKNRIAPCNLSNSEDILIKPVSVKHQSQILGCARSEDVIASVSRWHILLSHFSTDTAPTVIEHTHPLQFSVQYIKDTQTHDAELGRYHSDNWMNCIAIHGNTILTGQFDGSIFLWTLQTEDEDKPEVFMPKYPNYYNNNFLDKPTVKQILLSAEGKIAFALHANGLSKIATDTKRRGFRKKPEEASNFESMYWDEDRKIIYIGTTTGTLYKYHLEQKRIEPFANLSGFSCPSKKINVIKKLGALICFATEGGNVYTHDINRHPSTQKITQNNDFPICDILPVGTSELIISKKDGSLERMHLS